MFSDFCVWILLNDEDEVVTECGQQLWLDPDTEVRYCPYCGARRYLVPLPPQIH